MGDIIDGLCRQVLLEWSLFTGGF